MVLAAICANLALVTELLGRVFPKAIVEVGTK
jgi:hypothetical protein